MLSHFTRKRVSTWLRAATLCVGVAVAAVAASAAATSCAPLTFSDDGILDYEEYSSVRIQVEIQDAWNIHQDEHDYIVYTAYLIGEMRRVSGFETVIAQGNGPTDVFLSVNVTVTAEASADDDGDNDYTAEATFVAYGATGEEIDRDEVNDTSDTYNEAIEDVLDEIAAHYIRPYRI